MLSLRRRRHRGSFEDDDDGYEDKTGTWLDDSRRLLSWVFEFGSEYGMDGKGVEHLFMVQALTGRAAVSSCGC